MRKFLLLLLFIFLIPVKVHAETITVDLGPTNPKATGSMENIVVIGDKDVKNLIATDSSYSNTVNPKILLDGTKAWSYPMLSLKRIADEISLEDTEESAQTVLLIVGAYNGISGNNAETTYQMLVDAVKGFCPNARVVCCLPSENREVVQQCLQVMVNVDIIDPWVFKVDSKPDYATTWQTIKSMFADSANVPISTYKADNQAGSVVSMISDVYSENVDAFRPRVTVVHSLNARMNTASDTGVYYMPTQEDLPLDLQALIESGTCSGSQLHQGFAAAYMGLYDIEAKQQEGGVYNTSPQVYKRGVAQREYEILGYDFALSNESCSFKKENGRLVASYKASETKTHPVLETVIMDLYKALGKSIYVYDVGFCIDTSLSPETSPLQKDISLQLENDGTSWDNTQGACYVFVTRSKSKYYMDMADNDKLFTAISEKYNSFERPASKSSITLVEFCQIVAGAMQLYGEPVMTQAEEDLLLQVYGKYLPTYISEGADEQGLDAIKYLVAKGIISFEEKQVYEWSSKLEIEDMLSILMAVQDVDSRATFKDIQLTITPELQAKRYYETSVCEEMGVISDMSYNIIDPYANSFDYVISTDAFEKATYKPDEFQVKRYDDISIAYLGDVVRTEDDKKKTYYHFRISRRDNTDSIELQISDKHTVRLLTVGGVYELEGKAIAKAVKTRCYSFNESKETWGGVKSHWVDNVRMVEAQSNLRGQSVSTYLAADSGAPIFVTVPVNKVDKFRNCVMKKDCFKDGNTHKISEILSGDVNDIGGVSVHKRDKDDKIGIAVISAQTGSSEYTYAIYGFANSGEFHDAFKNSNKDVSKDLAFQKDSNKLMVSLKFLKECCGAKGLEKAGGKTHVYVLETTDSIIYLDTDRHVVINGNAVYKVDNDQELVIQIGSEYYIDYRAALGWTQSILIYKNQDEGVSVATRKFPNDTKRVELPLNNPVTSQTVPWLDAGSGQEGIYLQNSYAFANYLVYYGTADDGFGSDVLFVFKPVCKENKKYKDKLSRKYLKARDLDISDTTKFKVYTYVLQQNNKNNPPGIIYVERYGYIYKPPGTIDDNYKDYFRSPYKKVDGRKVLLAEAGDNPYAGKDYCVLPFIKKGDTIYDINYNVYESEGGVLDYGVIPFAYASETDSLKTKACRVTYSNIDSLWAVRENSQQTNHIDVGTNVKVRPAAVDVAIQMADIPPYEWKDVEGSGSTIYLGTAKCKLTDDGELKLGIYTMAKRDEGGSPFKLLKYSSSGSRTYLYNTDVIAHYDVGMDGKLDRVELGETDTPNRVDFESITLDNAFTTLDDGVTLSTYFLLSIVPRIVLMVCILLITLSLATNLKPWIWFCDNVFDVYYVLTLRQRNVHTINAYNVMISSIFGIGVFWLFMDGHVTQLMGWIVRAVVGIAQY